MLAKIQAQMASPTDGSAETPARELVRKAQMDHSGQDADGRLQQGIGSPQKRLRYSFYPPTILSP